ncbi:GAF domain-containing protein [Amycolatopsis sp. K13G38]|uniref:GAF domain-containing protein n=1 Tax=Amycolatopsis acididurans TaxID=2724524 RepID=A0ABX1IWL5_9PSEU|nr:LuxR C-terminal-related transcriptional regulator [Amycolatopsis acididurans]NKQ51888.1 GAF domain-containing protein [Amycolatopsis acididurans]
MRTERAAGASRRAELTARARKLLNESAPLTGTPAAEGGDLTSLDAALAVVVGQLTELLSAGGEGSAQVGGLLARTYALRHEVREFRMGERLRRLDVLDAALAKLRHVHEPDELLDRVCEAVVEGCGFDRVLLSRVEGSLWRPWKSYAVGDRDPERAFRQWLRTVPEIQLGNMLLETEMVRRHEPALVTDPDHDPRVYQPLLQASSLTSYVAAPLMPTGRVIGFLHADYLAEPVTPLDRDVLWAFAVGFGQIFERAVLLGRLREQREQVRAAMRTVEDVLDDLASAEIELTRRAPDSPTRPVRLPARSTAALESLLTSRELEVLALMATGATNNRIADELVIAGGTVKSHVKRILRKLCVENRAEAISQYLRLTMGDS